MASAVKNYIHTAVSSELVQAGITLFADYVVGTMYVRGYNAQIDKLAIHALNKLGGPPLVAQTMPTFQSNTPRIVRLTTTYLCIKVLK